MIAVTEAKAQGFFELLRLLHLSNDCQPHVLTGLGDKTQDAAIQMLPQQFLPPRRWGVQKRRVTHYNAASVAGFLTLKI